MSRHPLQFYNDFLEQQTDSVQKEVHHLATKVDQVSTDLHACKKTGGALDEKVGEIQSEQKSLQEKVREMSARLATYKRFIGSFHS